MNCRARKQMKSIGGDVRLSVVKSARCEWEGKTIVNFPFSPEFDLVDSILTDCFSMFVTWSNWNRLLIEQRLWESAHLFDVKAFLYSFEIVRRSSWHRAWMSNTFGGSSFFSLQLNLTASDTLKRVIISLLSDVVSIHSSSSLSREKHRSTKESLSSLRRSS